MPPVRRLLALVLIPASFACSDSDPAGPGGEEPDPGPPEVANIRVQAPGAMLWAIGETMSLTASAIDADGHPIPDVVLAWTSSASGVASVSEGVVTARGDGVAAVRVSASGAAESVHIVVVTADSQTDRTDCMGCHILEYNARHGGSGTPATCLQCHSGPTWSGAGVDHPAVANGFELVGAHAAAPCTACHAADGAPLWPGVADDECIACHQADYDAQHADSGYPTTCLSCHDRDAWAGGVFDHPAVANGFELVGAHAAAPCTACHGADGAPLWPGVADDECIACHQADYDAQHADSGYPTTCLSCHDRDAWAGGVFDHDADYFPIQSGRHQGGWTGCPTCHVNPADFTDFSCFACHPHDQSRMDPRHDEVPGYAYESALCYACHPRGEAD